MAKRPAQQNKPKAGRVEELESENEDLRAEVRQLRLANEKLKSATHDGLLREAEPLLRSLEAQGKTNMVTMSPGTVAHLTCSSRDLI